MTQREPMSGKRVLFNFLGFQASWFALVLGAAAGTWALGIVVAIAWFALHLALVPQTRGVDLRLLGAAALMGFCFDSALVLTGLLGFSDVASVGPLTTPWMVTLWAAFSLTMGHSLAWLAGRHGLAAMAGALCGPVAYTAGQALGAVQLPQGWLSLFGVAVVYAVATPVLFALRVRLAQSAGRAPALRQELST